MLSSLPLSSRVKSFPEDKDDEGARSEGVDENWGRGELPDSQEEEEPLVLNEWLKRGSTGCGCCHSESEIMVKGCVKGEHSLLVASSSTFCWVALTVIRGEMESQS